MCGGSFSLSFLWQLSSCFCTLCVWVVFAKRQKPLWNIRQKWSAVSSSDHISVRRPDLKPEPVSCISVQAGPLWDEIRQKNSYKLQHLNVQCTKIVRKMSRYLLKCKNVTEGQCMTAYYAYYAVHLGENLFGDILVRRLAKALQMYKCTKKFASSRWNHTSYISVMDATDSVRVKILVGVNFLIM